MYLGKKQIVLSSLLTNVFFTKYEKLIIYLIKLILLKKVNKI